MSSSPVVGGRRIAALALPALGVLAAEPLYLLFDLAVVGRLGAVALSGLAIGGLVLGLVGSQLNFLSYGTTARSARLYGAGARASAVGEGVQATWLAFIIGAVIVVVVESTAVPRAGPSRPAVRSRTRRCRGCASRLPRRRPSWFRSPATVGCAAYRTPLDH